MSIDFEIAAQFPVPPEEVYTAWLDSDQHSEMTGGKAESSDRPVAPFNAWGGYIQGVNIELIPNQRILQKWRTSEFEEGDEDSLLEILFEPNGEGTMLTIKHSNLPANGMKYKQGWVDAYFTPMRDYFQE